MSYTKLDKGLRICYIARRNFEKRFFIFPLKNLFLFFVFMDLLPKLRKIFSLTKKFLKIKATFAENGFAKEMNINLLPGIKTGFQIKDFLVTKQGRYRLAALADLLLILLIIYNGANSAQKIISPWVDSINPFSATREIKTTKEVFSFAPGLAQNKFDSIDFTNLNTLAFFDVPIGDDGLLNTDSQGYASFKSDAAASLFQKAHANNTKVVMTITQEDDQTIDKILNDSSLQENLINQSIGEAKDSGVDGVLVDFEYQGATSKDYQKKLNSFLTNFKNSIHQSMPNSELDVAILSGDLKNENILAFSSTSKSADKVFVISSDTAVPESKEGKPLNPVFGFSAKDYWNKISFVINDFFRVVPENKLVMERAWYGNGDNYPLYDPQIAQRPESPEITAQSVNLDPDTLNRLLDGVPDSAKAAARQNIPLIVGALKNEGILDSNVLAYALATIEHETDETFQPISEIQGKMSARRLGYEGGMDYYGRGFIQLTHLRNYKAMSERIGMGDKLAEDPDLASKPEVAAKILAAFFKDNNIANLASQGLFIAARTPINPDLNAYRVAELAQKFE